MAADITTIYPHKAPELVDKLDALGSLDVSVLLVENVAVNCLGILGWWRTFDGDDMVDERGIEIRF